jgi:hypothetical protein
MHSLILAKNITKLPGTGVELSGIKPSNIPISTKSGAKCGARETPKPIKYPELAKIVESWPGLPEHIKAAIKALVKTNKSETK